MKRFPNVPLAWLLRAPIEKGSMEFNPACLPPGVYRIKQTKKSPALVITIFRTILYVDSINGEEKINDTSWVKYIGKKVWETKRFWWPLSLAPFFVNDEASLMPLFKKEGRKCFFCDDDATFVAIREDGENHATTHCCDKKLHQVNAKALAKITCPTGNNLLTQTHSK